MKGGGTEEFVLADMTHWVINLHQKKAQAPNSAFSDKIRTTITFVLVCVNYKLMCEIKLFDMRIEITCVKSIILFLLSVMCQSEQCLGVSQHSSTFP